MGLRLHEITILNHAVSSLRSTYPLKELKICSLGYPDILASRKDVAKALSIAESLLTKSAHSDSIRRHHNLDSDVDPVCFEGLLQVWNASLVVIDIETIRGGEHIIDLNVPNSTGDLHATFDIVIDNGTLEHCFNIGVALSNAIMLAREGGFMFHISPFNMANHGFYNLNPTWFYDIYTVNGFSIVQGTITSLNGGESHPFDWTRRFQIKKSFDHYGNGAVISVLAKRVTPISESVMFPIQSKYKASS